MVGFRIHLPCRLECCSLGFGLFLLVLQVPLVAQTPWVLQSGPERVEGIPLDPPELVPAWRGRYENGVDVLWVYLTQSPHFFGTAPLARRVSGTPWMAVVFFPSTWSAPLKESWFELWQQDFLRLFTLPQSGVPVSFPAVLRKG